MADDGRVLPFPGRSSEDEAGPILEAAIEAALFAAGEPVPVAALCEAVGEVSVAEVRRALGALRHRYSGPTSGLELVEVATGWQLRTDPRFAGVVLRLRGGRPTRLSKAALETVSIVAYRQPVTRQEVERLRGVDSGAVLKALIDRRVLRVAGRAETPGRPLQYATTPQFLELFSLRSLDELPTLADRIDSAD